jgi:Fungal cellulose binding domain
MVGVGRLRFIGLVSVMGSMMALTHCAKPKCDADNFAGVSQPTHIDGCCEPKTQASETDYVLGPDAECVCPLTGGGVFGTPVCNAAGDAFDCTGCPPPYVEGNPCDGSRFLACQVVANEQTGVGDAPVMRCDNGTWSYAFTCDVNCGTTPFDPYVVFCGLSYALEGTPCQGMAASACSSDRNVWLRCGTSGWFAYETCAAGTRCDQQNDTYGCY